MQYKPGQSGNLAGRPKGAIGLITRKRAVLAGHLPEIVIAVQQLATFGDSAILTKCLRKAIEDKIL